MNYHSLVGKEKGGHSLVGKENVGENATGWKSVRTWAHLRYIDNVGLQISSHVNVHASSSE
jgi:hypothetical protein